MEQKWKKWFRKDNLIVLVLVGILLFVIALPTTDEKSFSKNTVAGKSTSGTLSSVGGEGQMSASAEEFWENEDDEAYIAYLEKRLKEALSRMADVGEVEVMITLQTSEEIVVEKEQPVSRSTTNENDSQGGSRVVSEMDSQENTVYRTDGSVSEPYVVKTIAPRIEGVLVVAEGAGNGTVSRTITEVVQTLFGVEAHKVKVVKMTLKQ